MAQGGAFTTLGDLLLLCKGDSEPEEEILERVRLLAQENLPEGWTGWLVRRLSKDDVFGENLDPQLLNKLRYALPTVGLARAFNPEADHLSEKCYRDIKVKLLDWEFSRALIISPPAVANKIRGTAAQSELFNRAIETLKPLLISRPDADKILSGIDSESDRETRKRRSSSSSSFQPKRSKVDELESKMNGMFAALVDKIEKLAPRRPSLESGPSETEEWDFEEDPASDTDTWKAPAMDADSDDPEGGIDGLDFRPSVKEAEPPIPEPLPQIKEEGIQCQRFGQEGWSRLRYKEVEKRLHAAPVFNTLKINSELAGLSHPSSLAARQDGTLGTIVHGLLLQRRALSAELKTIAKNHPAASGELRKILGEGSQFRTVSDDLLQFTCGHRAETIEMRRRAFKTKNDTLSASLQQIPPSPTHLFEEKSLASFVKDNGGARQIFRSTQPNTSFKKQFRKPATPAPSASKQPTWRAKQQQTPQTSQGSKARGPTYRAPAAYKHGGQKKTDSRRQGNRKY